MNKWQSTISFGNEISWMKICGPWANLCTPDKMVERLQTTFWNTFHWKEHLIFSFKLHCCFFLTKTRYILISCLGISPDTKHWHGFKKRIFRLCIFQVQWFISNDLAPKLMVFASLSMSYLINISCIVFESTFTISLPKLINIAPLWTSVIPSQCPSVAPFTNMV